MSRPRPPYQIRKDDLCWTVVPELPWRSSEWNEETGRYETLRLHASQPGALDFVLGLWALDHGTLSAAQCRALADRTLEAYEASQRLLARP